ncbi:pyridoxal kinase [Rhodnius prolixus]|uniref:Pyridoxal kinase n=2 Tax=Rhodnius TaxID=13248 RepID=R4G8E1_RHOPR
MEFPRVLSIQSHVVRGYVGNKSATFPLQVLGFEVDAINSVQLSNHTGYKSAKGQILDEKDLGVVVDALIENKLLKYTHVLTGYVGSPSFLKKVGEVINNVRNDNPDVLYVCDPVLGDNGKLYVPESLIPIYRDVIIPLADVVTPNQFELELLCGKSINTIDEAWKAMSTFHDKGCKTIILSSSNFGGADELLALASTLKDGVQTKACIKIPKLDALFTGTGDLFSALFLAWSYKTNCDIQVTLDNIVASMQAVLKRTLSSALEQSGRQKPNVEQLELKLIQSKEDIEHPKVVIHSEIVE